MDKKIRRLVDEYLKADVALTEATQEDVTSAIKLTHLQTYKEQTALELADYISKNLDEIIRSQSSKKSKRII